MKLSPIGKYNNNNTVEIRKKRKTDEAFVKGKPKIGIRKMILESKSTRESIQINRN